MLFGKVYDVAPGGGTPVLPVAARRARPGRGRAGGQGRDDHAAGRRPRGRAGHRLRLVLASTDLGYASPAAPADVHRLASQGDLTVPTAPGADHRCGPAAVVGVVAARWPER